MRSFPPAALGVSGGQNHVNQRGCESFGADCGIRLFTHPDPQIIQVALRQDFYLRSILKVHGNELLAELCYGD